MAEDVVVTREGGVARTSESSTSLTSARPPKSTRRSGVTAARAGPALTAGPATFSVRHERCQIVEESEATSVTECVQSVANSTGRTGKLVGFGSDIASANDLTLLFCDLPVQVTLLTLASEATSQAHGGRGHSGWLHLRNWSAPMRLAVSCSSRCASASPSRERPVNAMRPQSQFMR